MKRIVSLFLVVVLLLVLLPVTANAAENDSAWVELLEYSTVDNSGYNLFNVTTTKTISIDTPQYMTCTKVDMLITHPAGYAPSSVKLRYNNVYYTLTMKTINNTTVRVYGSNIPDGLYANLVFQINKSSSTSMPYQVLSCRVTSLATQDFSADADVLYGGTYYDINNVITVPGSTDSETQNALVRISVYDWMKYDSLTIWGYSLDFPLTSIRATVGTLGLPMTVSYIEPVVGGYYTETEESESGYISGNIYSGDDWSLSSTFLKPMGQWLYCVTIDLSEVDRTATTAALYVYMTGLYQPVWGFSFNCNNVIGSIVVADTSDAAWWTKFQTFMTNSFNSLTSAVSTGFSNVSSWISSQTSSILSSLSTGFTNVSSWISSQTSSILSSLSTGFTNVGTWISDQTGYLLSAINTGFTNTTNWFNRTYALIGQSFGDLSTWLEQYFGQVDPDAEDFSSTMESEAGDMQDAVDELDQVTKPDVEDLDVSLDDFLDADAMDSVSGFLDVIFANDMVVTMLIVTLTCAFASYALFGKR